MDCYQEKKEINQTEGTFQYKLLSDYKEYISKRNHSTNKKSLYKYNKSYIALTYKQIKILNLISLGYSNVKIAHTLLKKENSIKLSIYRLNKIIESQLNIKFDRYSIIIFAQTLKIQNKEMQLIG